MKLDLSVLDAPKALVGLQTVAESMGILDECMNTFPLPAVQDVSYSLCNNAHYYIHATTL